MLALGLQTLLLMSAAYILGAALGCWMRRQSLAKTARVPVAFERRVEPLPELDADVVGARRFVHGAQPAAEPLPAAAVAPAAARAAVDLQQICGIDAGTAARLKSLGISRFEEISAWRRADLEQFAQALSIARKRISRENWIEQAQVLAAGGRTRYADRRARGEAANAVPSADQGERKRPIAASPSDRPTKAAAAAAPASNAATRLPAAAAGAKAKVAAGPASTPQVSERAAFARERLSPPADRVATGEAAPKPPPPAANAGRAPASAVSELVPARPVRPPPPSAENLRRIRGITVELAERLSTAGVVRYEQIANWSAADVERFDRQLATRGAIARENWIEQAQILGKGGDTAFSRAFDRGAEAEPSRAAPAQEGTRPREAAPRQEEPASRPALLGSLRSVRSQAYQNPEPGPEAAHRVGSHNRVVRSAPPQDLKRIRGIGVLIERRLNAMQIATYEQIANWTAEDIERVSRTLDFKGRIERENWVEQARILASGGATEFSRRVDRGDVETGRYRP
jgi:predicted flap endonuclease-1-like 5' DNA nuclease